MRRPNPFRFVPTLRGATVVIAFVAFITLGTACDAGRGEAEAAFIEIAAFSLATGTTEPALFKAFDAVQREFMDARKGLIRRELAKKSSREFVEILYWRNRAYADEAYAAFYKSPVCQGYLKLLRASQNAGSGVQRAQLVRTFAR